MFNVILLRFAARNVQSLLDFITKLDAAIDGFVAKEEAKISANEKLIADLTVANDTARATAARAAALKTALPTA